MATCYVKPTKLRVGFASVWLSIQGPNGELEHKSSFIPFAIQALNAQWLHYGCSKINEAISCNIYFRNICIVSWPMYRETYHIVKSQKSQRPNLKFSDTKEHLCSLLSYFHFQCIQLKYKSALKFHFSFWCYGSYISAFGNFN